jgi:hypothetical protein
MMSCSHLDQIRPVKQHTRGCEECLKLGLVLRRSGRAELRVRITILGMFPRSLG